MMATLERKSSIRKAPITDVVEALTATPGRTGQAGPDSIHDGPHDSVSTDQPHDRARPGVGRPRSRRRMEPFSSKIEILLRDRLDEYLHNSGMTVVDFLDEAIRDRLSKPYPAPFSNQQENND